MSAKKLVIRIIKSQNDGTQYILLPDAMYTTKAQTRCDRQGTIPYDLFECLTPSLTKSVVRRILNAGPGCGKTRKWGYSLQVNDTLLKIGCQHFDYTAIQALRRWTGAA